MQVGEQGREREGHNSQGPVQVTTDQAGQREVERLGHPGQNHERRDRERLFRRVRNTEGSKPDDYRNHDAEDTADIRPQRHAGAVVIDRGDMGCGFRAHLMEMR